MKGCSGAISCLVRHLSIQGQILAWHQVPPPSPLGVALGEESIPSSSQQELGGEKVEKSQALCGVDVACEPLWQWAGLRTLRVPCHPSCFFSEETQAGSG